MEKKEFKPRLWFWRQLDGYFKKINKIHFPINKDKFEEFLLLSWPLLENSCFLRFVERYTIEEWVL